ncbi:MAG: response regulator, partial [Anaerolineales bacterium]|nr:response regulator [Anaerolineales bacterium]
IQMPEMDGVTTTEHIHREWSKPDRPLIVAMTANALVGDSDHYLASGMDAYIAKPIRLESLRDTLMGLATLRSS